MTIGQQVCQSAYDGWREAMTRRDDRNAARLGAIVARYWQRGVEPTWDGAQRGAFLGWVAARLMSEAA